MIGWVKPTVVINATALENGVSLNCTLNELLELSKQYTVDFEYEIRDGNSQLIKRRSSMSAIVVNYNDNDATLIIAPIRLDNGYFGVNEVEVEDFDAVIIIPTNI